MKLTAKATGPLTKTSLLVVPAVKEGRPALPDGVKVPAGFLSDFKGDRRSTSITWTSGGPAERVILVGLGAKKSVDTEGLRRAAAIASKLAERLGVASATIWIDDKNAQLAGGSESVGRAWAEGARLGAYRFVSVKSKSEPQKCRALSLVGPDAAFRRGVRKGGALAEANAFTRDLQNSPGNEMTPTRMAAEARKLARKSARISCKVLDERAMKELGMGLLIGVSAGSTQPAKLIHLTYKPKAKAKGKVSFVGKGLTFDAGGISIKPSGKMDEMRYDMSGGAAVLGAFHALSAVDVPWEVHGVVPCSENLIDGNATKPGDVHTAMNGATVEINNTDAEGRLILADALCYVERKIKPETIIDLATLTGAAIMALGHELTAIYPSTERLRDQLVAAGEAVGERVWPMPLLDVHKDAMKGQSADLTNIASPAIGAGSVTGAAFLSNFVAESTEWCHMDIAGTAWGTAQRDWVGGPQGSGVGSRLLIEYLESK